MDNQDEKYIVFKRVDFAMLMNELYSWNNLAWIGGEINKRLDEILIEDAVVIRRQDVFSPPALDMYANSILTAIDALQSYGIMRDGNNPTAIDRLHDIAAYFHNQAEMAWGTDRKIPD